MNIEISKETRKKSKQLAKCPFCGENTIYETFEKGDIVDEIQQAYKNFDGIVINPAAYTHTSVAILDALKAVSIPTVEVHISEVSEREAYRQISYVREYAFKTITGHGTDGYLEAIDALLMKVR